LYAPALPNSALSEICVFSQFSQALTWNGFRIPIGMAVVDCHVQSQQPQPSKQYVLAAYKASFRAATVENVLTRSTPDTVLCETGAEITSLYGY
jgi:hypothetical protein